ncbi:acyl-CoA thioesterase [bacterium]|nr:acyl-CoA thioesterase [bacterium]
MKDPTSTTFLHQHLVQFVETDMAGIVHFSNFFRFMEEAEDAFLRHVGVPLVGDIEGKHVSLPRLSASCDYRHPARYGDRLQVAVQIKELREKTIRYRFRFSTDQHLVAEGEILAIYCEFAERLRSIPITPAMREKLLPHLMDSTTVNPTP